jgi:hypothetical protein
MQVVKRLTPFAVLVLTALVALAAASAALVVALDRPWLGLTLSVDGRYDFVRIDAVAPDGPARSLPPGLPLVRIGGIALETGDLVEEPDVAESYAALKRFLERQSELHAALAQPDVTLETGGASAVQIVVTPAPRRPVASLPPVFWVQIATGLVSMMVGAWVWSLRRGELSAGLLALAGAGVLVSAFPAAVYSSR